MRRLRKGRRRRAEGLEMGTERIHCRWTQWKRLWGSQRAQSIRRKVISGMSCVHFSHDKLLTMELKPISSLKHTIRHTEVLCPASAIERLFEYKTTSSRNLVSPHFQTSRDALLHLPRLIALPAILQSSRSIFVWFDVTRRCGTRS